MMQILHRGQQATLFLVHGVNLDHIPSCDKADKVDTALAWLYSMSHMPFTETVMFQRNWLQRT
jgi:hypothetical protein